MMKVIRETVTWGVTLGDARAWWANFTAAHPANQVQWFEFHEAFHAQHIPADTMRSKHREFMDLQ
jgi:hypothetical protein